MTDQGCAIDGQTCTGVPVEVTDGCHALRVVGHAGTCAIGVTADPANPPTDSGYSWIASVAHRGHAIT